MLDTNIIAAAAQNCAAAEGQGYITAQYCAAARERGNVVVDGDGGT